ncbi:MAG: 4-(cytidine 5'-diphospho)-2-C-methyl-D-erythritol kinase [Armatimonadetes bacterium]|nr:4-(cytidine 5'-diphospho)-2-C-methyl-D-erythritol kinase [Armatimonadota bacterium]
MQIIPARCCAKINLTLDVLDRRADGYHNIESVMQSIDLADALTVQTPPGADIEVMVDVTGVPGGPENTVYTAARLFREASGLTTGIKASITKRIPAEAGLGGGSSDAAGALRALNTLFGSPLSDMDLAVLASRIGSDVPYFLVGGTAVVSGRGEIVRRLPDAPEMQLLVVKPAFGVSTAWAYKSLAASQKRHSGSSEVIIDAIMRGDRSSVVEHLHNDFQEIVVADHQEVAEVKRDMAGLGAEACLLCGSGSAVFGVFHTADDAHRACAALKHKYPFSAAVGTTTSAITIDGTR